MMEFTVDITGFHPRSEMPEVGLADMLRYDAGVIVERLSNGHVRVNAEHCTVARWASFGLPVVECYTITPAQHQTRRAEAEARIARGEAL